MAATEPPKPNRILQLAWGYAPPLIIAAAVRVNLFGALAEGGRSVEDLARTTGASCRGLRAILNALVGLQLVESADGIFSLTAESAVYLVPGRPEYRGDFFHHHTDHLLPQWMRLDEVLRTGQPVAATNREDAGAGHFAGFVESLFAGNYPVAKALARHLRLGAVERQVRVLDIGAGSGVWGIALAEESPRVSVRAVDFPEVLEITRRIAGRHHVADRLTTAPGDFFAADFGEGHDIAVLGHILHSEGVERVGKLIGKVFRALAPGGLVAIQEFVPDDDRRGPILPLLFAVNMLVNTEAGDTYTFAEIRAWLEAAGFTQVRVLEVPSVSPLVLADKPC